MTVRTVVLIGNPNCGKTTLFNRLTGARQRVGNWPGVTVEKKSGELVLEQEVVSLIDLPGIYSLNQSDMGIDEKIASDFLTHEKVDLVINLLDAANLERNLVLTQELSERNIPLIVALNMLDVASQHGLQIDVNQLETLLCVPVVPIVASKGQGMPALIAGLIPAMQAGSVNGVFYSHESQEANGQMIERLRRASAIAHQATAVLQQRTTVTDRIDQWVLNRFLGIPFFLLMMYLMFTLAVKLGAVFIDFFDIIFGALLVDSMHYLLADTGLPEWLISLMADGLGGGIQLVATFIPVIGFLYLCLSLLEDSGYMSRAAFVIDRLMGQIGLPGTAFVPLIVGFGCNVPSVMATRSLGNESDRLLTIAMAPFMSCGARLTVFALFATVFFKDNGQNLVFALYLLGICMAIVTGFLFRRRIFRLDKTPSFQEMPAYHLPVLRNILLTTWFRLKGFIFRAGKTIVAVFVALSLLNSLGPDGSFGHQDTQDSLLARIGKTITPLFAPIGIREDNWPATVGLFTGVFAKEAVVGTLDALYSETAPQPGSDKPDLTAALAAAVNSIVVNSKSLLSDLGSPLGMTSMGTENDPAVSNATLDKMNLLFGSSLAAFSYLVFVLLYVPCAATVGVIANESNSRWTLLVFGWTLILAYITAGSIYQAGTLLAHPQSSLLWLLTFAIVGVVSVYLLKSAGRRAVSAQLIPVLQI